MSLVGLRTWQVPDFLLQPLLARDVSLLVTPSLYSSVLGVHVDEPAPLQGQPRFQDAPVELDQPFGLAVTHIATRRSTISAFEFKAPVIIEAVRLMWSLKSMSTQCSGLRMLNWQLLLPKWIGSEFEVGRMLCDVVVVNTMLTNVDKC